MMVSQGFSRSRRKACTKSAQRSLASQKRQAKRALRRAERQALREGKEPSRAYAATERNAS